MTDASSEPLHPLLSPIGGQGLAESVTSRVAEAIRLGLLAPGQQLPRETVLAARLGVSTVTLREALATLREQGLVETRRGRRGGSFVIGPPSRPEAGLREQLRQMTITELRDIGDEQVAVSAMTARLAAMRASDANISQMFAFAEQLAEAESRAERVRAHSRFHIEVALASQSERLTRAQLRLQAEAGELLWVNAGKPRDPQEVAVALVSIATAIQEEDAERARALNEKLAEENARWLIQTHLRLMEG